MSTEEKKKKAEEEGNALVSIKAKLIKGAGDALKTDGKEAAESASEGVGEVLKGMTSGFDKILNQILVLPDSLASGTFEVGTTEKLLSDSAVNSKVSIYLIAKEAFTGSVRVKAYDEQENEVGRSSIDLTIEADEAGFYDFEFDKRTPLWKVDFFVLEVKSKS